VNKNDIDLLAKFWTDIEQNFYHKAHHLQAHFLEYVNEHGPLPLDSPNNAIIERMLDAAAEYKECNHE